MCAEVCQNTNGGYVCGCFDPRAHLENSSHKRNRSLPLDPQCPQTEMAHI